MLRGSRGDAPVHFESLVYDFGMRLVSFGVETPSDPD